MPTLSALLAYVGSHGTHVFTTTELNPARQTGATDTAGNEQARRNFANLSNISESNMGGNTRFQSMQITLKKTVSHGLSATFNYTWSKSLDNIPYNTAVTSGGAGQANMLPIYVANLDVPDRIGNGYGGNACGFGVAATTTCVGYLDPTAFATPALDTFGIAQLSQTVVLAPGDASCGF